MNCRVNPKDRLPPKVKEMAIKIALEVAHELIIDNANKMCDRHENMAILALQELGWGKVRLQKFVDEFEKQKKRLQHYENDVDDFDYRLMTEIEKIGLDFDRV